MMPNFSACIRPMSPEEFLSEYRGKKPVYFPGTLTQFESLLGIDDINEMLSRTVLGLGTVRIRLRDVKQAPLDDFSMPVDMNRDRRAMKARVIEDHLKAGATLSVEHSESFFKNIHTMCCTLAEAFIARVYATLFLVYQGERPCGLHWDDRDMFIFQVTGHKNWPVYRPPYANPFLDSRRVTYKAPAAELYQEFKLHPGDVLYIPRGWAHDPAAIDGASMHVAFAIASPTALDLMDWVRADLHKNSAEMRADLPIPLTPDEKHRHAARLRELIMERLSDDAIESYYQRHTANINPQFVELPKITSQTSEHNGSRKNYQEIFNVTNA
jgi:ribosomal protein L16 Arg81 hydroxylase